MSTSHRPLLVGTAAALLLASAAAVDIHSTTVAAHEDFPALARRSILFDGGSNSVEFGGGRNRLSTSRNGKQQSLELESAEVEQQRTRIENNLAEVQRRLKKEGNAKKKKAHKEKDELRSREGRPDSAIATKQAGMTKKQMLKLERNGNKPSAHNNDGPDKKWQKKKIIRDGHGMGSDEDSNDSSHDDDHDYDDDEHGPGCVCVKWYDSNGRNMKGKTSKSSSSSKSSKTKSSKSSSGSSSSSGDGGECKKWECDPTHQPTYKPTFDSRSPTTGPGPNKPPKTKQPTNNMPAPPAPSPPSPSPPSGDGGFPGNREWYADYSLGMDKEGQCVQSCPKPAGGYCGGIHTKDQNDEIYPNAKECCDERLWWMGYEDCVPGYYFP